MRSYGQLCSLAKALDVVGDRWSLLIVRELLLRERCRYTDLQSGLPGIATNLLADRLRRLEDDGIVRREEAPPPVATTVFSLTERGRGLEPVVVGLATWGAPLVAEAAGDEEFRTRWMALPLKAWLRDRRPDEAPASIEVRTGEEPFTIEARGGDVATRPGPADEPRAVLSGQPKPVLGVLTGWIELDSARAFGVELEGDRRALERVVASRDELAGGDLREEATTQKEEK